MTFDLGQAWNDGTAKLRDNFQLLAVIAGVFLFIPGAVFGMATPEMMSLAMSSGFNPDDPSAILSMFTPGIILGYIGLVLLSLVGYVAMLALMDDTRKPTVGDAIGHGFRSLPTLIATMILFLIGYFIVGFVLALVAGLIIGGISAISTVLGAIVGFFVFAGLLVAIVWLFTRLSMTMPVIAIDKIMNPVTALVQSWKITGPAQWRLLAFYVLLIVAYLVIALLLFGLLGMILSSAGGLAALGLLNALVGAGVGMLFSAILAGVHAQLAGSAGANLADTFE